MEQAGELAKNTSILMNVSEFDDVNTATDTLISSLQAFKKEGQDVGTFSMEIIDKYNEVGNNYAISTSDLAESLTRSSAALVAANNSLEQSIAMTTAANTTIQDPEAVGNALKVVSMRIRGVKTELEEAGEDTEGMVTNTAKLQEKIMALTNIDGKGGINILTESGEFKSTYDILLAISKVWKEMDDTSQAALLELVAGKTRGSVVAALFQNGDVLEDAYESASNASGSAMNELNTYLDSIQGRIDLFKNSLQTMWMNLINSEVIKFIVDLGTGFIKIADSVGPINALVGAFTGIKTAIGAVKVELDKVQNGTSQFTGTFTKSAKQAVDTANAQKNAIEGVADATQKESNVTEVNFKTKQKVTQATSASAAAKEMENAAQDEHIVKNAAEIASDKLEEKGTWAQVAAEKALAVAKGIGKGVLFGLASFAISSAISGIITAISNASQKMKELTQSAIDSANELNDARDSIEDYKDEITDLRNKLADNNTTEQEAYDARSRLIEIQNSLTDSYGKEAENINLVTGAIDQQIAKLDELAKKKASAWFLETDESGQSYQKAYDNASEVVNKQHDSTGFQYYNSNKHITSYYDSLTGTNIEDIRQDYAGELGKLSDEARNAYIAGIEAIIAKYGGEIIDGSFSNSDGLNTEEYTLYNASFEGKTTEELDAIFTEINDYLIQFARDNQINMDHQIGLLAAERGRYYDEEYQQALELYNLGRQNKAISQYDKEYGAILDAEGNIYNATSDADRLKFIREYQGAVEEAMNASEFDPAMYDFFSDLRDKFAQEEFELQIKTNEDGLKTELTDIINAAGENGLSQLDNNQIKDLWSKYQSGEFEPGPDGTYVDYSVYTKDQVDGLVLLQDAADEAGISVDSLIDILTDLGIIQGRPAEAAAESIQALGKAYSTLAASAEKFANINKILNEAIYDNVEISEEQYNALNELIGSEEEFADCIDTTNGYIIKNSTLLRKLVNEKKREQKATIQQAKSYAQLEYKNTVDQLRQSIKIMELAVRANGVVSNSTLKHIGVLHEQIEVLKQTIQQYALLELSLSDAANAYSEFEAAKERDAQLTYGDSMIEALQVINDGFKTGQVGTETFQAAVDIMVPESAYAHIDDIEQRMIAIHDYIDKNPLFADWFTIDEGEFSINLDNINNFIDDAFGAGLFTGDSSGDFFLTDAIKNASDPLKEFANQLGAYFDTEVTEGSVLAMLAELEKYDASWGNIITDLTTTPLDRAINDATTALEEALIAQEEFIKNGGDLDSWEYAQLEGNVNSARQALDDATDSAIDNAQAYTQVESVIKAMTGECELSREALHRIAESLGIIKKGDTLQFNAETGALELTDIQLQALNEHLTDLKEPTILDIQLAYDEIDRQIRELEAYIFNDNYSGTIVTELSLSGTADAEQKLAELTADREAIELIYNITSTSTAQDQDTMSQLATWETNGVNIVIKGDTTDIDSKVAEINETEMDDKPVDITADPNPANEAIDSVEENNIPDKTPQISLQGVSVALSEINSIDSALDNLSGTRYATIAVRYQNSGKGKVDGNFHVSGGAFANGSIGAPKTELALTGELGPEMIVRNGRWFTVGQNGAEFTQIKKGDIIFNHKQTEDLLSKGYVTSRGKAYANGTIPNATSGTAYYRTFGGYVGDNDVFGNGSDNWVDPYTNTSSSLSNAADSLSEATDEFREVFDWIEVRLEELDEVLSLMEAKIENAALYTEKNGIIDEIIRVNKVKLGNLKAGYDEYSEYANSLLTKIPEQYRKAAQNGAIAIEEFVGEADETTLEAINNYREWAQKAADLKQQAEEVITTIRDLAIQKFDNAYEAGDVRATVEDSQTEKLQNAVDYDEERGLITSDAYYIAMMENSNKKIEYLTNARKAMQKELNAAVEAGQIERGSNEWYELIDQMYQIDASIDEATIELEEFQNAINDLYWDNLEQLTNRLDYLKDETQSLIDLMDSDDLVADPTKRKYEGGTVEYWTAEDVKLTDEGIASLGLYAQQMEIAEYTARQYAKAIDDLEKDYKAGLYSENEYIEKLNELKDAQYDNIESYYDAQDAIVELNEARVDAIKEGIEKEIEAYEELIEKKKEELDAEKDLYDFQKSTMEQQKNIADIERRLAALANDNSLSAAAKRKQLEAELAEAQYELQDTYYNRSIEDKQTALDKELEDFQTEKDAEIAKWDEYLTNVEAVVAESLDVVQANAINIYDTLSAKAKEYDLTLSDAIMTPWQDSVLAVSDYQENFDTAMSSTMDQLEALKNKWREVIDTMAEIGNANVTAINKENANYAAATTTKTKPTIIESTKNTTSSNTTKSTTSSNTTTQSTTADKTKSSLKVGSYVEVKPGTKWYSNSSGGGAWGYARSGTISYVNNKGSHAYNIEGLGWIRKTDIKGYASGTKGVAEDQLALLHELGDELVLSAGPNGKLQYITRGTAVIPHDISENLMELGQLDPSEILSRNTPQIGMAPSVVNNTMEINMNIAEVVHIDSVSNDTIPDLTKAVRKEMDSYMTKVNNAIKSKVR